MVVIVVGLIATELPDSSLGALEGCVFFTEKLWTIVKRMRSSSIIVPDSSHFSHSTSIFVGCTITEKDPFPLLNRRKQVVSNCCLETIRE